MEGLGGFGGIWGGFGVDIGDMLGFWGDLANMCGLG